jgi:integrase
MALYKKADSPFWWADVRIDGKRHRVSTKEKVESKARQVETAYIQQLTSGETKGIRKRAPILRDYAEQTFLPYVAATRRSEKTKDYYRNGWRLMDSQNISGMRLDAITTATAEVLQVPHSGSNVNCALRTLRRMLSLAFEKNLIAKIPRIPLVDEVERDRLVEADEELIILAKAPGAIRDAYLLIADLGIRPDDAVKVSWPDVNFVTNEVFIVGGKTGKKAARYVKMSDRVRDMLLRRAKQNAAKLKSIWAFPSVKKARAGEHMTASSISSRFSKFKKKVGFPEELVLYSARHTFATDVTESTGDITKTQKILGHTSLRTTSRYNHSRGVNIAEIMNARNSQRHVFSHGTETVQ